MYTDSHDLYILVIDVFKKGYRLAQKKKTASKSVKTELSEPLSNTRPQRGEGEGGPIFIELCPFDARQDRSAPSHTPSGRGLTTFGVPFQHGVSATVPAIKGKKGQQR
eukprot:gene12235-3602_t